MTVTIAPAGSWGIATCTSPATEMAAVLALPGSWPIGLQPQCFVRADQWAAATTPAGPPVAGYVAWYDASQITGQADNTTLSSWPDLSGNGNNLSTTTPATYYSSTAGKPVNGKPAVWFNTSSYSLGAFSRAQPYTLAYVVKADTTSGTRILLNSNAGNTTFSNTGTWRFYGGVSLDSGVSLDTATHAVFAVANGASSTIQVDATAVTGNAGGGGIGGATNYVGSNNSVGGNPWSGAICEIFIYPSALSAGNITSLRNYFRSKWGTP
jgi:hypothetical protein